MSSNKKTKKVKSIPSPDELFATSILYLLEISKTAEEFYFYLSEIILLSDKLTQDERQHLADLVKEPFKRKRGAGIKEQRYHDIYYEFIFPLSIEDIPETEKLRRTDAIEIIMERYKITADAAGKSYDIARKYHGDAPPPKESKAKGGNK
jgi:hypothetical protein